MGCSSSEAGLQGQPSKEPIDSGFSSACDDVGLFSLIGGAVSLIH
jgi:hypothetical protein